MLVRILTLTFSVVFLLSCNTNDSCSDCSSNVRLLEKKVDSLQKVITSLTPVKEYGSSSKKIKKKKKGKDNITVQMATQSKLLSENLSSELGQTAEPVTNNSNTSSYGSNSNPENTSSAKTKKTDYTPSYSSQCAAITKKGYRCSRTARSGGYCWQHGG